MEAPKTIKTALLIDDEPEICLLLSNLLRRSGVQCVTANSVAQGRDALARGNYDVVFFDVHLSDGLGYDLIPIIKALQPHARLIAISALDMERERAVAAGADVFVPKPFDREIIASSIRALGFAA